MTRWRQTVMERFFGKLDLDGATSCWPWTSYLMNGYGQFWTGERVMLAHRFAYEQWVGPIPPGLTVDHLCRNRACQNVLHMELVTRGENTRRGAVSRVYQRKGSFACGHEYTPENTARYFKREGWEQRDCRTCRNARTLARYHRNKVSKEAG